MALILLLLIGAVFGFGFKVRILIPATLLTIVLACSVAITHQQGSLSTALVDDGGGDRDSNGLPDRRGCAGWNG
jgi:hypothetical protein